MPCDNLGAELQRPGNSVSSEPRPNHRCAIRRNSKIEARRQTERKGYFKKETKGPQRKARPSRPEGATIVDMLRLSKQPRHNRTSVERSQGKSVLPCELRRTAASGHIGMYRYTSVLLFRAVTKRSNFVTVRQFPRLSQAATSGDSMNSSSV